jgi:hypothetical protein
VKPYHFAGGIKPGFKDYFGKIELCGGVVCFDFEDSLDPHLRKSSANKNDYRKDLLKEILDLNLDAGKLGFRINSPSTDQFADDVNLLREFGEVKCIFLPKTESSEMLRYAVEEFLFETEEIIPVVETKRAFGNIEDILSFQDDRFRRIAYGHCDHNYSLGMFPFFHQWSNSYWIQVSILDEACRRHRKELVNSPLLELNNDRLFKYSLGKSRMFASYRSQVTLSLSQCQLCCEYGKDNSGGLIYENSHSAELSAEETVKRFEQCKVTGKSFSFDTERRIISPHEYRSALRIIQNR